MRVPEDAGRRGQHLLFHPSAPFSRSVNARRSGDPNREWTVIRRYRDCSPSRRPRGRRHCRRDKSGRRSLWRPAPSGRWGAPDVFSKSGLKAVSMRSLHNNSLIRVSRGHHQVRSPRNSRRLLKPAPRRNSPSSPRYPYISITNVVNKKWRPGLIRWGPAEKGVSHERIFSRRRRGKSLGEERDEDIADVGHTVSDKNKRPPGSVRP